MKNTIQKSINVISCLVQKHIVINNKVKQNTLNQQNYQELDNRLDNLQKLIGSNSSTSDIEFYKCASVDAENKTWSGYKVIINDDIFQFENYLNNDLIYNEYITPEVGKIYPNGCAYLISNYVEKSKWLNLSKDVQNGLYTLDRLGEIIEVDNTELNDVGLSAGKIQFKIVAIDNADLVDNTKVHSITLMATNILFRKPFDSKNTDGVAKWHESHIRTYLQNEFINCLDPTLISIIAKVNRSHTLYDSATIITAQDTIFIPSYTEIGFGGNGKNKDIYEGIVFNYMSNTEKRESFGDNYWLSSMDVWSGNGAKAKFCGSGYSNNSYAKHEQGIVPCFVIA